MNPTDERRQQLEAYMIRYGRWARSERGIQGYPKKSTLYNVIQYGPSGAAAIRASENHTEDECPLEESIEEAVSYMSSQKDLELVVRCLKARYLGLIKGRYFTELPDSEAAKYLNLPRQSFYREVDRGLRFIDGWLRARYG